jgi:hypothetical protein
MNTLVRTTPRIAALAALLAATPATVPPGALAIPLPAQPVTDVHPPSKSDPVGNANPFNLTQVEDLLFFFAHTAEGPALFARNIEFTEVDGSPVVEMVGKKVAPKLVVQFKATQTLDDQVVGAYLQNLGTSRPKTLNGALYFHIPGKGLYMSRGTPTTTICLMKTDKSPAEADWMRDLIFVRQANTTTNQLLFSAVAEGKGREVWTARTKADTTSSNALFDKKQVKLLADLIAGAGSSDPAEIVSSMEWIFFTGTSPVSGQREIFASANNSVPTPLTEGLGAAQGLAAINGDCAFAGPSLVPGETDLYSVSASGLVKHTTHGASPLDLTPANSAFYFSMKSDNNTGRELGRLLPDGAEVLRLIGDINPGPGSSDPGQFVYAGSKTYFTAFDGTARRLYRTFGSDIDEIRASDGALLSVDAGHEKVWVSDVVYFTAIKAGQTVPWLWKIDINSSTGTAAYRVNTPSGFPVTGATELMRYRSASVERLYFSCDGTGTEFNDPLATDRRLRPRGREVWVTSNW